MDKQLTMIGRREWIVGTGAACAALCAGPAMVHGACTAGCRNDWQQDPNPFDQNLKRPITYRDLMRRRWGQDYIPIMKALAEEIGPEPLHELIRTATYEKNRAQGERMAQRAPDTGLRTLMAPFRNPNPTGFFTNSNTWEVLEDTENAFEIRVTACLAAEVFLENDAAELGFATVCHADYGLPAGFNPRITLERDKTIMQGDGYCNHRYVCP